MFGIVPFDFRNRSAAQDAMRQFAEDSVWEISMEDKELIYKYPIEDSAALQESNKNNPFRRRRRYQSSDRRLAFWLSAFAIVTQRNNESFEEGSFPACLC